jgi:hypothetical protein
MKKILFICWLAMPGMIAFSQTAVKKYSTDKMPGVNCDNIVHNTLPADADNRSASECEVQFDWKVRTALRQAFSKALQNFPASDWMISDTAVRVLREVSKQSEQYFFNPSYYFNVDLKPESKIYQALAEKQKAVMEELKTPNENTFKKFTETNYKTNNAVHIRFYVLVNDISESIYYIKGGQQVINIPGAAYAVKGSHAGALSGGGEENSMDACFIVFGKPKINTQKEDNGGASVNIENNFPKAVSRLTVQEISVRIECNDELLNKILKDTDFKAIGELIGK